MKSLSNLLRVQVSVIEQCRVEVTPLGKAGRTEYSLARIWRGTATLGQPSANPLTTLIFAPGSSHTFV